MKWINGKMVRLALTAALLSFGIVPALAQETYTYEPPPEMRPLPLTTVGYLDLRDAPVRQSLELVLGPYRMDYSIDNAVAGYVTVKAVGEAFEGQLRSIQRSVNIPLVYDVTDDNVYLVRTPLTADEVSKRGAALWGSPPRVAARRQPRNVAEVPRRVAGVWCEVDPETGAKRNFAAILETGNPCPGADVEVVRLGNHVPSSMKRVADLTVIDIDTKGLTLETQEEPKQRFTVPLANINRNVKETRQK